MKKIAIVIGAFIWFFLVFRVALGVHFPLDTVKKRLQWEVEQMSDGGFQVEINDLGLDSLRSIVAKCISIHHEMFWVDGMIFQII